MRPRLSCADFTFPLLPHSSVLKLIRLLGVDGVDIGIFEGRSHHYPSQIAADPIGEARKIASNLDTSGLLASDVFLQTGSEPSIAAANTPDHNIRHRNRDLFTRLLEFTSALRCNHLTGLPGVQIPGIAEADNWQRACEEAAWRIQMAATHGIIYSVEPHVGSILSTPESTLRFVHDVPNLGLTLDYGHFTYQGVDAALIHPLIPHATHFHARGGARAQLQSTMKENTIDFVDVVERLDQAKYRGWICLEYVWIDREGCNRTDNISETILLMRQLRQARPKSAY